jgi:uncharacterized MAPEG superfamily protein
MDKLPYWMLLAALGLIYFPRLLVLGVLLKSPGGFDNNHPRIQQAKLEGFGARAQGAHMNAFEAFAPFAAGVLACEVTNVDPTRVAWLSVAFVVLRAVYLGLYVANIATARSLAWFAALGVAIALLAQPLFVS